MYIHMHMCVWERQTERQTEWKRERVEKDWRKDDETKGREEVRLSILASMWHEQNEENVDMGETGELGRMLWKEDG